MGVSRVWPTRRPNGKRVEMSEVRKENSKQMTTVTVTSYKDLKGDQVSSASEKDRIIQLLDSEPEGTKVFRADEWLWEDDPLEPGRFGTVVAGTVLAETEKAYLVTQLDPDEYEEIDADDPQTDWVPKSVVRIYEKGSPIDNTGPQSFLGDYEK